MIYILPFLFSLALGYLTIALIYKDENPLPFFLHLFLASGLGLGMSGLLLYLQYITAPTLPFGFIIILHVALIVALGVVLWKKKSNPLRALSNTNQLLWIGFGLLILITIPVWIYAKFFPLGGWDAWSCWNFKARYLFLAKEQWTNMFDPLLWRSNTQYPFLLPLINVWYWAFGSSATPSVTMANSIIFTFLTVGVLFFALKTLTKNWAAILAPVALLSIPIFVQQASSQYSDILVGYYYLASIITFILGMKNKSSASFLVSGLMLGPLSFSKSEGLALTALMLAIGFLLIVWKARTDKNYWTHCVWFLGAATFALLPTISFQLLVAPDNEAFINGFVSQTKPSDFTRLDIIMRFLLIELVSKKWMGLWIVLLLGIILSGKKGFRSSLLIAPLTLGAYAAIIIVYYHMNTYFEITWWLSVTLNRILFAILPAFVFWVFFALFGEKSNA